MNREFCHETEKIFYLIDEKNNLLPPWKTTKPPLAFLEIVLYKYTKYAPLSNIYPHNVQLLIHQKYECKM